MDRNVDLRQPESQCFVDDAAYHLHDFMMPHVPMVVDDAQLPPLSNVSDRRALSKDCEERQSWRYVAEDHEASSGDDLAYLVSFSFVHWDRKGPEVKIRNVLPY